ncbi:MAG: KH domain-containing protein [Epsilonproteobacteria bacterium]|nr:KH domain-containing protein [Campylobacterota bacterium]
MSVLKELVEFIVKKLVDRPEQVSVTEVSGEQSIIIELHVSPEDLGKVIGKEGRTARSIRTLVHAAASKEQKRAVLEILE